MKRSCWDVDVKTEKRSPEISLFFGRPGKKEGWELQLLNCREAFFAGRVSIRHGVDTHVGHCAQSQHIKYYQRLVIPITPSASGSSTHCSDYSVNATAKPPYGTVDVAAGVGCIMLFYVERLLDGEFCCRRPISFQ